jgi:phosphopantothenoylcysteine decarboxylase/phosphopantothenate--cysteine ligase
VTLVTTVDLPLPIGVYPVRVESAAQMRDAVLKHAEQADAVIMAAAVADFRPLHPSDQKIKKQESGGLTLELGRTDDILLALRAQRERLGRPRILIGFAAESDQLLTNARRKLEQKGLDLLVANDITAPGAGFAVDTNRVTLLFSDGRHVSLDLMSKSDVAERIIDELAVLLTSRA